jgi:hypothetical protein
MLWDIQVGKQDTKAFQEEIFISVLASAQQIHIQRLSPENKGASPYIPLHAGYRARSKVNPYVVACNCIDYFILDAT